MHALRTLHRLVGSASAAVPHARSMTIHRLTMLKVADNSGAKEIKCIGHVRKSVSRLGDTIRAVSSSRARAGGFHLDLGTGGVGTRVLHPPRLEGAQGRLNPSAHACSSRRKAWAGARTGLLRRG